MEGQQIKRSVEQPQMLTSNFKNLMSDRFTAQEFALYQTLRNDKDKNLFLFDQRSCSSVIPDSWLLRRYIEHFRQALRQGVRNFIISADQSVALSLCTALKSLKAEYPLKMYGICANYVNGLCDLCDYVFPAWGNTNLLIHWALPASSRVLCCTKKRALFLAKETMAVGIPCANLYDEYTREYENSPQAQWFGQDSKSVCLYDRLISDLPGACVQQIDQLLEILSKESI